MPEAPSPKSQVQSWICPSGSREPLPVETDLAGGDPLVRSRLRDRRIIHPYGEPILGATVADPCVILDREDDLVTTGRGIGVLDRKAPRLATIAKPPQIVHELAIIVATRAGIELDNLASRDDLIRSSHGAGRGVDPDLGRRLAPHAGTGAIVLNTQRHRIAARVRECMARARSLRFLAVAEIPGVGGKTAIRIAGGVRPEAQDIPGAAIRARPGSASGG